jgi:hypothetical protein
MPNLRVVHAIIKTNLPLIRERYRKSQEKMPELPRDVVVYGGEPLSVAEVP